MPEWAPGRLAALLGEIDVAGRANQRNGLLLIAAAIEAKAKAELSKTSHPYGTPSPARKSGPPSLVSGTARRSVGHQEISAALLSPVVRVGMLAGVYPPRQAGQKTVTASSKYMFYQETLARFDHPFLLPSFESVVREKAVAIWLKSFRTWPRMR